MALAAPPVLHLAEGEKGAEDRRSQRLYGISIVCEMLYVY